MGFAVPPIDFAVHGLDPSWTGPRWLEEVHGHSGRPCWSAWLGHGTTPRPEARGAPWVLVGSVALQRYVELNAAHGRDLVRELALATAGLLVDRVAAADHETEHDEEAAQARRATRVEEVAAGLTDDDPAWSPARWSVDGEETTARVITWSGGWAGFTTDLAERLDTVVAVVGAGLEPDGLHLAHVEDLAAYGVDPAAEVTHAAERASLARAFPV